MKLLTREELRAQLNKGEISPIYLLFGAEKYLRNQAAKAITEKVLRDDPVREFNETEFSLNDTEFLHAISSAEQMPMISPKRVVKITEIHKLKESDEDALTRYVENPADFSVVIFIADELDKRRRFVKTLLGKCVSVEFGNLSEMELLTWTKGKLKELNAQADERTLRHITALVGNNVLRLTNEIEKLATATLPESVITEELVEQLVPNSREISNFDLTDHLLAKDRIKAMQILKKILDDGAEPLMLLGLIAINYRRLLLAKELMSSGVERKEVARAINLPYFKQEEFLATARRSDAKLIAGNLIRIAETDLAIKTSKSTPRIQIELLVAELLRN